MPGVSACKGSRQLNSGDLILELRRAVSCSQQDSADELDGRSFSLSADTIMAITQYNPKLFDSRVGPVATPSPPHMILESQRPA